MKVRYSDFLDMSGVVDITSLALVQKLLLFALMCQRSLVIDGCVFFTLNHHFSLSLSVRGITSV